MGALGTASMPTGKMIFAIFVHRGGGGDVLGGPLVEVNARTTAKARVGSGGPGQRQNAKANGKGRGEQEVRKPLKLHGSTQAWQPTTRAGAKHTLDVVRSLNGAHRKGILERWVQLACLRENGFLRFAGHQGGVDYY